MTEQRSKLDKKCGKDEKDLNNCWKKVQYPERWAIGA